MFDVYAPRTSYSFRGKALNKNNLFIKGVKNANFKASNGYEFDFKINDVEVGDVKQPLQNMLVYSDIFEIITREQNDLFKVGNYILFDNELYIIKRVSVAHSPMQYVYYNLNRSIYDTTKMTIEKVQQ